MNLLKIFYYIWPLVREVLFNHEQERLRPLGMVALLLSFVLALGYLTWTDHGQAIRESFFPTEEDSTFHYQQLMEERITELLDKNMELNKRINKLKEEQTWEKGQVDVVRIRNKGLKEHVNQLQSIIDTQNKEIQRLSNKCTGNKEGEDDATDSVHDRIRDLY